MTLLSHQSYLVSFISTAGLGVYSPLTYFLIYQPFHSPLLIPTPPISSQLLT